MSEEVIKEEVKVCDCFKKEELAVIFNTLGDIPLKLNSPEIGFVSQLRAKVKFFHDQLET